MRAFSIIATLGFLGCNPPTAAHLSQLNSPILVPSGGSNLFNGEFVLTTPLSGSSCAAFDAQLTGTEDGVALTATDVGETPQIPNGPELCVVAEFDSAAPPDAGEAVTVYTASDGTSTIHAEYPSLHAARQLSFSSNGPWAPGDLITMAWLPSTDTLVPAGSSTYPAAVAYFTINSASGATNVGTEMQAGDGQLIVTVPASAPPGMATLNITIASVVAASTCTGPATCGTYGDTYSFAVQVEITSH